MKVLHQFDALFLGQRPFLVPVQGPGQIILVNLDLLDLVKHAGSVVHHLTLVLLNLLLGSFVGSLLIFEHSNFSFCGGTRLLNLRQTLEIKRVGLFHQAQVLLALLLVSAKVSHEALVIPAVFHLVSSALEVGPASFALGPRLKLFS